MNDTMSPLTQLYLSNPYLPKEKWLQDWQEKHLAAFLERGFPTRSEEQWKYTDTSMLAQQPLRWGPSSLINLHDLNTEITSIRLVFVNGYFSETLSDLTLLPSSVILCSLNQAFKTHRDLLQPLLMEFDAQQYPFACLNSALLSDGIFLSIPNNNQIDTPIHCVYINTGEDYLITCPRNVITVGENSQVIFLEEYRSKTAKNYLTNTMTTIQAKQNARVHHYKLQAEQLSATHIANIFVTQERDSFFNSFNLSVGGRLSRDTVRVFLQAPGATSHLNGFYRSDQDNQHIDNQLQISHLTEQGTSTMFYKGILDKKSRAVFNGKVFVHQDAQKINAEQANHNLLLSSAAEVNSKPELEIYANDVKCTHGATVGQLDSEALFYLQSRGIEKEQAMVLLTHAFATEVFNKIEHSEIKHYAEQLGGLC